MKRTPWQMFGFSVAMCVGSLALAGIGLYSLKNTSIFTKNLEIKSNDEVRQMHLEFRRDWEKNKDKYKNDLKLEEEKFLKEEKTKELVLPEAVQEILDILDGNSGKGKNDEESSKKIEEMLR